MSWSQAPAGTFDDRILDPKPAGGLIFAVNSPTTPGVNLPRLHGGMQIFFTATRPSRRSSLQTPSTCQGKDSTRPTTLIFAGKQSKDGRTVAPRVFGYARCVMATITLRRSVRDGRVVGEVLVTSWSILWRNGGTNGWNWLLRNDCMKSSMQRNIAK